MSEYKFYMKRFGTDDDASQVTKDLEVDFSGLRYKEASGLLSKGAPKNIYTEDYSDSDELRYYVPEQICREATEVSLTFVFIGDDRNQVYEDFYAYVKEGPVYYWDTARKRRAALLLTEAVEVDDDIYKGNPYIEVEFQFQNLYGEAPITSWIVPTAILVNADDAADIHTFESCEEAAEYVAENSSTNWELTINHGEVPNIVAEDEISTRPQGSFATLTNLVKLTFAEGVTRIGNGAFLNCVLADGLTLPASLTEIGISAFAWCSGFTGSLTIPSSVTSIGDYAFFGCFGFEDDLSYGGTSDPNPSEGANVFADTNFAKCKVPSDYEDSTFCGLPVEKE